MADETDEGVVVGIDANDLRASLDFAIETFDQICRVQLCPVLFWEGHIGEHILFGIIHDGGELWHLRPYLAGDVVPLAACRL